jgi:hypothetical protein
MTETEKMIDEIRFLAATKFGERVGVLMRSFAGWVETEKEKYEVIEYTVLTPDGMYLGFWMEPMRRLSGKALIAEIIKTEQLVPWDELDDDELMECREFLRRYAGG